MMVSFRRKGIARRSLPVTIIEPAGRGISLVAALAEYGEYSALLRYLTLRDLRLRFQSPLLGIVWVTLMPLLPATIFATIFAKILQPGTGGVPYALYALAGFVPWTFFSTSVSTASMTFVWNANLLNKVYFPRAVLPASAMLASSAELLAGLVLVCGYSIWRGYPPLVSWLWLPVLGLYVALIAFIVSLGLATANALNRNVKFAIPFLMQIWIYATPVVYPISIVAPRTRLILALNPLTGALDAFRAALLGTAMDHTLFLISLAATAVFAIAAVSIFRRYEALLAERV
jgi:lipopolysaccharide transport system permease protein